MPLLLVNCILTCESIDIIIVILVEVWYSLGQYIGLKEDKLSSTTVDFIRSTVVDESLSSFKPMYCSREYQASTRLSQQYEKSSSNYCYCFTLRTVNSWHLIIESSYGILGRTFGAILHRM